MKVAIHSVFIAKENILFLEEWIDYHIQIGVDVFYLYDNSKVQKKDEFDSLHCPELVPGKINKYGISFDTLITLTTEQINEILEKIQEKYKNIVHIIEWSPVDDQGIVCYNQQEAHNTCLSNLKKTDVTWCISIDIDEFVITNTNNIKDILSTVNENVHVIYMSQQRFESRFDNLDKNVIDINKAIIEDLSPFHSNKYIYNVEKTYTVFVHSCNGHGSHIIFKMSELSFNHYKMRITTDTQFKLVDNIDSEIKNIIHKNSKTYIIKDYTP
jgi:hypothetical protein